MSKTTEQLIKAIKDGKKAMVNLLIEKERLNALLSIRSVRGDDDRTEKVSFLLTACSAHLDEVTKNLVTANILLDDSKVDDQIKSAYNDIDRIVNRLPNFAELFKKIRG